MFPRSKAILNFAARSWEQFLLPKYSRKCFQNFEASMFIIVSLWGEALEPSRRMNFAGR